MRPSRTLTIAAAVTFGVGSLGGCSSGGSSTDRAARDTSAARPTGTKVAVVIRDTKGFDGPMTMTVSPNSVAAGLVTLRVKSSGTIPHEMVVVPTHGTALTPGSADTVSETGVVGALRKLPPGTTKLLTLNLPAGEYQLMCNFSGHFARGLHVPFSVT